MEKELIIKGLECCEHIQCQGEHCPYHPLNRCREQLRHDCYALIKELTEENEKLTINMNAYGLTAKRLAEENERLRSLHECPECKHFVGCEPSTLGGCDLYEEEEKK